MNKLLIHTNPKSNIHDIAVVLLVLIQMQIRCQLDCSMTASTAQKNDLSILNESISQQISKFADESTNI